VGPASTRLPSGFTIALQRGTRVLDSADGAGVSLLGGSPVKLLHLTPAARRLLGTGPGPGPGLGTGPGPGPGPGCVPLVVRDATGATLARRLLDAGLADPVADELPSPPGTAGVTVVVPVRDRPQELRRLLAALGSASDGLAGVIVVDDGSREGERCRQVAEAGGARVLRHATSQGPAAARNTGLAAATSEYVAFLDSDVVPSAGWLAPLLAHLVDPAVGLVAPRIVGLPAPNPGWLTRYEGLRSSLDLGPHAAPVLPRSRVAYVPSAALVVRRAAIGAGFDPDMPVAEDVDLVLRLYAAGWRMRYEPEARVAHEHRADAGAWWTRKAFYGTGAAPLAMQHPGSVPPSVLAPWTAVVCLLAGWQRPRALLAALGVTAFAGLRLRRTLHRLRRPGPAAARLTGLGLLAAAGQCASLLLRHWWPLTVPACLLSRRVRRATLAAALVEGTYDWGAHRAAPGEPGLDLPRYVLAHRLDDLGYGAGLWWGAWRRRTLAPLVPVITWKRRAFRRPN
jgi:mycofactocin system glycosyltransferase